MFCFLNNKNLNLKSIEITSDSSPCQHCILKHQILWMVISTSIQCSHATTRGLFLRTTLSWSIRLTRIKYIPSHPTCSSPQGGPASSTAPIPNFFQALSIHHGALFSSSWEFNYLLFSPLRGPGTHICMCFILYYHSKMSSCVATACPTIKKWSLSLSLITPVLSPYFLCRKWRHLKVQHGCLLTCSVVDCLTSLPRRSPPQDWRVYLLCTLLWLW